jgi:integrase/recombinase XerC
MDHVAEYVRHLHRMRRAEATITSYSETLRRLDKAIGAGLIAALPDELEAWLFNDQWSKATQHQRRAAVVGFFTYWSSPKRQVRLDYNPAADLPTISVPRGRPRPAPKPVLEDLLARAGEPFRTWMLIAAFGGARCVEISNLNREDVTEEEMDLLGKGGKVRVVPTHELIWQAVKDLPAGPVAVASDGSRLTRHDVSRLGNRRIGQLGHDITMHQLRHYFGTEAYEACGHDLIVVQELLGHASPATTQIYVQPSRAGMRRAVAGLAIR